MLFTTWSFLLFLAACTAVYWLLTPRLRWGFLLGISLVFYWSIGHKMIVFALFTAGLTWLAGVWLGRLHASEQAADAAAKAAGADRAARAAQRARWRRRRRLVLAAFCLCSIGMLLFFKFYNMLAALTADTAALPLWRHAVPLGVSFYTLQVVAYVADVYTGRIAAERNPFKVALFTIWFPQVIEGPICRWNNLAPTLFAEKTFDERQFVLGCERMLWGYFKKLVIADRFNVLVNTVFGDPGSYAGFTFTAAAFFYVVQLYCDFSGGIDIALGAAGLFGVSMPENFCLPFSSQTISEFWRRWHITLGTFLRDYIFYPLTLSRPAGRLGRWLHRHCGRAAGKWVPSYLALFILWFCSGVWHGEGWHYVVYGLYHGTIIIVGMMIAAPSAALWKKLGVPQESRTLRLFRVARTCLLVGAGEILFRADSTAQAAAIVRSILTTWNPWVLFDGTLWSLGLDFPDFAVGVLAAAALFAISTASRRGSLRERILRQELPIRWAVWLGGLAVVLIFGIYGPAYDPTPFVYYHF